MIISKVKPFVSFMLINDKWKTAIEIIVPKITNRVTELKDDLLPKRYTPAMILPGTPAKQFTNPNQLPASLLYPYGTTIKLITVTNTKHEEYTNVQQINNNM